MILALLLAAAAPSEPAAAAVAAPPDPEASVGARPGASQRERDLHARLLARIRYDNCVRTNALAIAALDSDPETLAKAALAFCREEELKLWVSTVIECRETSNEGNRGAVCADRLMAKWRVETEREAFGCIAGTRFKPAAIGVSLCKMMDPSSARASAAASFPR